jgi:hypothetical protein
MLGAGIGILCGMGLKRGLVLAALWSLLVIGASTLIVGLLAAALAQPYEVFYPLLLCGAIATPIALVGLPMARRRYEWVELRKMRALDTP